MKKLNVDTGYNGILKGLFFTHVRTEERKELFELPDIIWKTFAINIGPCFWDNFPHYVKFEPRCGTENKNKGLKELLDFLSSRHYKIGWKDYKEGIGCYIDKDCNVLESWELDDGMC